MSIMQWLWGDCASGGVCDGDTVADMEMLAINPASGLPMAGGDIGGVDVGGSPWGMDIHQASWEPATTDFSIGGGLDLD